MYCTNCGKQQPNEAAFCPFCGTKTAKTPERKESPAAAEIPDVIPNTPGPEPVIAAPVPQTPPAASAAPVIQAMPAPAAYAPQPPAEALPDMKTGLFVAITAGAALGALFLGICAGAGIGSIF